MNILILKVHSNFKHEFDVLQMLICEIFEALGIFGSERSPRIGYLVPQQAETADGADVNWNRQIITA